MKLRVGILDIGAAGVVLVAILLPAPSKPIRPVYGDRGAAVGAELAVAQGDHARAPRDPQALQRLVELLLQAGQRDWALRVAGDAHGHADACDKWWPALMVSVAHTERLDVKEAYEWAERALEHCRADGCPDACGGGWRGRLEIFSAQLKAGLDSGIDPRTNPTRFREAIERAVPMIRVGPRAR